MALRLPNHPAASDYSSCLIIIILTNVTEELRFHRDDQADKLVPVTNQEPQPSVPFPFSSISPDFHGFFDLI
jgi:hypothetical protein